MRSYKKFEVYIIDRETGEPVVALAEPASRADLVGLRGRKWNFNWTDIARGVDVVYKITLGGQLQGLIGFFDDRDKRAAYVVDVETAPHNRGSKSQGYIVGPALFAVAASCSIDWGHDGYLFFEAKTRLIPYYRAKIGADLTMPPKGMSINDANAVKLIQDYIKEAI